MTSSKLPRISTRTLLRSAYAFAVAALLACASGASATATSDLNAVWSFGGGKIAIQQLSDGSFAGTVVATTNFATCPHPIGEQIWTNIHQLSDGSYDGFHQWFVGGSKCIVSATRGLTAWRVLQNPDGSHYLRVCFSTPGSTEQPAIAPNGTSSHVNYGCSDSALIAGLPVQEPNGQTPPGSSSGSQGSNTSPASNGAQGNVESFANSVVLPSAGKCLSHRSFRIHLRNPTNDPLRQVIVEVNGHRVGLARTARAISAGISLKNLPRGAYTVKILVTTVLGRHLTGTRRYHTCAAKARHSKPGKLHRG